ncbi:MAG: aminotransferase class V-fold PLP-dependent enzyme [Verrucomicrobiia bacterium]
MDTSKLTRWLPDCIASAVFKSVRRLPGIKKIVDAEYETLLSQIEEKIKPYKGTHTAYTDLPEQGKASGEILAEMKQLRALEMGKWEEGFVSGAVYHGDADHIDLLNQAYALNSQSNPLHLDVWPSAAKYEAEIVSMTAKMLGAEYAADKGDSSSDVCGVVSSGGTESILLAMKTYRDWARDKRGIKSPEIIVPSTVHVAFDKAAHYFGIKITHVPVGGDYRADVEKTKKLINKNTIALVGSAPCFPHGVIDPIEALSELARERGIGFHTDACLGGFVLPWAGQLGYDVPPFDFSLPGVTSISADTHKYGYAAKGTSVVLYRSRELRRYQYFTATEWPGGLYFSPTFAGSRAGGLSAACWASMVATGRQGYLDASKKILETAAQIKAGIEEMPDMQILGDPLWVIAFASNTLDIFRVMDCMAEKGWSLNGLHKPSCVHLCVTLRHAQAGIAQRFLDDLAASVESAKENPQSEGGMAPVYGMAATMPDRGAVSELLVRYMDLIFKA